MITIWDLDGTVIDTSHRYTTLPGGGIDLPAWVRDNTPDNVKRDSLLPLAVEMRKAFHASTVVILTARVMSWFDWEFLADNGLHFHECMSRPEGLALNDADYKEMHLRLYAQGMGLSWASFCRRARFYEDAPIVIERLQ